jgi:hypothetical protein
MKKISSSILFALFMTLTFSNTAIAGNSEESGGAWDWKDIWTTSHMYRCKVTYTRRNFITRTETKHKSTTQHRVRGDQCDWGARKLSKKIIKWMDKSENNIVSALEEDLYCKKRENFMWNHYRNCAPKQRFNLLSYLVKAKEAQVDVDDIY